MNIQKKTYKLVLVFLVLMLTMLACDWDWFGRMPETTATVQPAGILPPAGTTPTSTLVGLDVPPAGAVAQPLPTSTRVPPNIEKAACVPGKWSADHQSVVNYIVASMAQHGSGPYQVEGVSGDLVLNFGTDGVVTGYAQEFRIQFRWDLGGSNIVTLSFVINASGSANYTVDATTISLTSANYSVQGTRIELPASDPNATPATIAVSLNDLLKFANDLGFGIGISSSVSSGSFKYTCTGDTLWITMNPYASVGFRRVYD